MQYTRRFRAEASFGIGHWLDNLDNLCIGGIMMNCYASYFTSKSYKYLFIDSMADVSQATNNKWFKLNTGWE